jgi:hypothetical protein
MNPYDSVIERSDLNKYNGKPSLRFAPSAKQKHSNTRPQFIVPCNYEQGHGVFSFLFFVSNIKNYFTVDFDSFLSISVSNGNVKGGLFTYKENTWNKLTVYIDFGDDKIILYNIKGDNYEQTTIIKLSKKEFNLSLDIVEIPKLNQIAYYSNKGLYFYDLRNFEIKKSMENINGFEWTNTMTLFDDEYLILGSIYASCNEEDDKNFYLIKCSTYEVIDSYLCEELDYMFCTAMKVLNDKTILCGFHKYDSYSNYVHIKIDKEKINIIGLKRISDEEFEGEVCGIEQYEDMLVAGNRNGMILLYK